MIYYYLSRVGTYHIYVRLKGEQAPVYPISIEAFTTDVSATTTLIYTFPSSTQTAGIEFTAVVETRDIFDNIIKQDSGAIFKYIYSLN